MNHQFKQQLAMKIIKLREEKGISSNELAMRSGVSKTGVRYIERCVSDPRVSTLERIAKALKIPLYKLFE